MKKICYKNAVFILIAAFCFYNNISFSQDSSWIKKLKYHYLSNHNDSVRRNNFFPVPVLATAPETGLEYGFAAIYSFYTNKEDKDTRVSTLDFLGTHTTKNQTALKLVSNIWTKQNKYHYYSEFRYRYYPYDFYGIGANTLAADKDEIYEKRARVVIGADKKIVKNYYIGLKVGFEKYAYRDWAAGGGIFTTGNYYDKYGGKLAYIGLQQTYDSRNNVTYTTKGAYAMLSFNDVPDFFGGDNYNGAFINFDGRYFIPVNKKLILGINGIYQGISGKEIPFYLLPELGSSNIMRGYYQGKFRDKNMAAAQAELRYRLVPRFAVVAFGGYGTVWGQQDISADMLKPDYGVGFRYFFDLNKGLTLRLDYGVGQKPSGEKRISGYYFSMSEAF